MKKLLIIDRGNRLDPVSYSNDWVDCFKAHPGVEVDLLTSPFLLKWGRRMIPMLLKSQYDGIFVMHSVTNDFSFGFQVVQVLRKINGPRFLFMGNEHRELAIKVAIANEMDCRAIFTQLPDDVAQKIYGPYFKGDIVSVPHGLNENAFQNITPLEKRTIDIGYRGEKYPFYLGHNERDILFEKLAHQTIKPELKTDFSAGRGRGRRLPRTQWAQFLNNCRATVATEPGCNYLSMSDKIRFKVGDYVEKNPTTTFEEVNKKFIEPLVQNGIYHSGRIISSRHFDSIGCGTAIISFAGRFNDILKPEENYIVMNADLSNLDSVLNKVTDTPYLKDLTARTRDMVLKKHCLKHRIANILQMIP